MTRIFPLTLLASALVLLAGCASQTKTVPTVNSPAVPGSATGPVYGQGHRGWSPQMDATERQLRNTLGGSGITVARTSDERLWLTVPGDVAFQANRSALKPGATALLDRVVVALRNVPNADVRIVGHTDARGSVGSNDALSLDRAASTRDWLVARGVSPLRIAVAGRGARDPIASNDDEAGRAANRRVEILIGEKGRSGSGDAPPR